MILRQFFLTVLCAFFGLGYDMEFTAADECSACLQLSSYTFEKIIRKFEATLVKIDVAYPYGEKEKAFAEVAMATWGSPDLLVAELGVKDFGERENSDIARRYDVKSEDYPVVLLFLKGKKEPHRFVAKTDQDFNSSNIRKFITRYSNIYLGLPGCIQQLDKLAEEFKSNEKDREKILNKAKVYGETLPETQQEAANVYIKTMEKILDKGDVFVQTEQTRIENLLKSHTSLEKKRFMEKKRNILQSFSLRDEL